MGIKLRRQKAFKTIRQRDASECGTTCLAMILKYYGMYNLQATLRKLAHVSKEGTSLQTLSEIAESFGFRAQGYRGDFDLLSQIHLPCIAHYEGNHFVVIYKISREHVWIADPAYGVDRLNRKDFTSRWNGVVLALEPTDSVFKNKDLEELIEEQKEVERSVFRKFYLSLLYPFKFVLLEILVVSFILQLLGLSLPFFTQNIIDRVLVYRDERLLYATLLGMLGIFLTHVAFTYFRNLLVAQFKTTFESRFFSNFFNHFLHLEQGYFDSHRREDLINRFQENLKVRRVLSPAILQPLVDLLFVVNFVAVLFFYNLTLAFIAFAFVLLMLVTALFFTPKLRRLENKVFHENADTMARFMDTLLGMQTVKLLSLERLKMWEWKRIYTRGLNRVLRTEQTYARLQSTVRGVYFLGQLTVYWVGALMALRGDLSIGQYIAFVGIFTTVLISLSSIFALWPMLTEISISYSRLNDVLATTPEKADLLSQRTDTKHIEKIELRDLSFRYTETGERYALRNVNLTIVGGEHLAIVGRNGSGKTTLAKLLTKLYTEYDGQILVNGVDLQGIHPQSLRKKIVMIPQTVYLFSGTISENIACGNPDASMADVVEAARLADIHDHVKGLYLGYNQMISEDNNSFSGGQRLKIAFARLFLSDPEVIILDEASSALDVETEHLIMSNLKRRFAGKTIISIAHRLHTVRGADRIIVLDDGGIVEEGNHHSLLERKGLYHRFINTYLDV
jgi:ATP-binding cassette subfamily B protein